MANVRVPAKYVDEAGADLGEPAASFLIHLGLLGTENQDRPEGLNELKEGATSLVKWWVGLAGTAGAAGLVSTIVAAVTGAEEPTRVALVAGGSLVAATAVLAVALIIRGDVRARAASTVSQYQARSDIALGFLALTTLADGANHDSAQASVLRDELIDALNAFPKKLTVRAKNHDKSLRIRGIQRTSDGMLQVRLSDGDWVAVDDIQTFTTG